jgi:hypothetical protein
MSKCPHTDSCALFPLFTRQAFLKVWQTTYCEADFARCIRYQRSLAGLSISNTLLPNGKELVAADRGKR